ncbi:hypothetical protein [Paeniglutamicibacter sp.]|uniref:hypothetical protein n=1 Tax=Paeniglutamicibacter sp. TaxID=1934391 RepID=UPI00398A1AE9
MLEARSRTNTTRIAILPGSAWDGELLTDVMARQIAEKLTCMDDNCTAPLQFVRASAVARAYFQHRAHTAPGCTAGTGEGAWHLWAKLDVFDDAYAHEHSIPGARVDAVIQRVGKKNKLIAIEAQYSQIDPRIVQRRHAAHRGAGIVGTLWLIPAEHLDARGIISKAWVVDLLEACLTTPAAPQGTSSYGCTVGLLDDNGASFIDTVEIVDENGRRYARVTNTSDHIPLAAVRWWAQGANRSAVVPEPLIAGVRSLDAAPTRRIKRFDPRKQLFKNHSAS